MGERTVTDEQLEQLVSKRVAERKEVLAEVVAELEPALEAMRREIAGANHVKRTLGRQLARLTGLVEQTNAQLQAHIALPAHSGTQSQIDHIRQELDNGTQLAEEFGLDNTSLEERQALPEVLGEHVREKKERKTLDRRSDRRMTVYLVVATAAGSLFGGLLAAIALIAWISSQHLTGGP